MSVSQPSFPSNTQRVEGTSDFALDYSICTLVTKPALYRQMVDSFRAKGFEDARCEYLYIDNTAGNAGDGYSGLNRALAQAQGRFVILCHQDVIAQDDITVLDACLAALTSEQPDWAIVGNAGLNAAGMRFFRITDRNRLNHRSDVLPARVVTLDENFLLVRAETGVRFSSDLAGFHLYGTDICVQASCAGHSAWVIDFHVEHLARGTYDASLITCKDAFEAKYAELLAPRVIRTTATHVGLGKTTLRTKLARDRHAKILAGKKQFAALRPITNWLEQLPYQLRELRTGPVYRLDGVDYRIPAGAALLARKALRRGRYEGPERRAVAQFLPRDCPVIELGGSYGIVSNTIRQAMGDDQHLVVVEAIPELAEICRANIRDKGRPTTLVSAALAYDTQTVRFNVTESVHTSSIVGAGGVAAGRQIGVPATSLASLRAEHGIDGRFALVCDIEGAEFDLLQREAAELADCAVIVMELHPGAYIDRGASTTAFVNMLTEAGFQLDWTEDTVIVATRRRA